MTASQRARTSWESGQSRPGAHWRVAGGSATVDGDSAPSPPVPVDDAGRGRLCWSAGFRALLGRKPPNRGAALRLADSRWRTSLRAPARTDTLSGQIGFCASNTRGATLEPLSASLQPHHSQLAQSSGSPLAGSSSAREFPAQVLDKLSCQPTPLEPHSKVQTLSIHLPPPQTSPPHPHPAPWQEQTKGPGEGWGMDWVDVTVLLLQARPWGTLGIFGEAVERVFHAPVFRQGGPGQDAASCPHTSTLTHTRPLPALVLGRGQNHLLNKDSAGKLPSVSQWSLPPHQGQLRPQLPTGVPNERVQW